MGVWRPLNVLWAYYFLIDSPESDKFYDVLEKDFPEKLRVSFLVNYLTVNKENLRSAVNITIFWNHLRNKRNQDALAMIENGTLTVEQISELVLS